MPVARQACSLDLPQGLPKKIKFKLLLADLAFQLADAPASSRKIRRRLQLGSPKTLPRATGGP
jgi:hypothetical protein